MVPAAYPRRAVALCVQFLLIYSCNIPIQLVYNDESI